MVYSFVIRMKDKRVMARQMEDFDCSCDCVDFLCFNVCDGLGLFLFSKEMKFV